MSLLDSVATAELQKELNKMRRRLNDTERTKVNLEEAIGSAAFAAFSGLTLPEPGSPTFDRRTKGEEVAVPRIADLQLHKITPSYNAQIAADRMEIYAYKVQEITEIQRADHPVKKAHIRILGDIVEGEKIFPGQEYLIGAGLIDQIFDDGPDIIIQFIYRMLDTFEKLKIVAVPGNHGRIGRPGQFDPDTNADRMLYLVIKKYFDALVDGGSIPSDRIEWDIPREFNSAHPELEHPGTFAFDEIGDHRTLCVHGDQFRGGNSFAGLPYYSFASKALRWRDMALGGELPEFNDIDCGHWHTDARIPTGMVTVRVAGSPESTNLWSMETLARTSRPSQLLTFIHPEKGTTAEYVIDLST